MAERELMSATLTKDDTFFQNASAFRTAANDLYKIMNALATGGTLSDEHAARVFAYTLSLTVLRALSAECMLKAITFARSGFFEREHDLSRLYAALDDGIKQHIESEADSRGVASPQRILDRHRTEFVYWRYPFEGDQSTTFLDLDRVLGVLEDVYRQIKSGNVP